MRRTKVPSSFALVMSELKLRPPKKAIAQTQLQRGVREAFWFCATVGGSLGPVAVVWAGRDGGRFVVLFVGVLLIGVFVGGVVGWC